MITIPVSDYLALLVAAEELAELREGAGDNDTPDYSQSDMDDIDNPEWTEEDFAKALPFDQAFPDLPKTMMVRHAQEPSAGVSTVIRLSPEVLEHFRSTGPDWQSRIHDALKEFVAKRP